MTRFLRRGHTYRIYDFGPLTIAFDPEAHGGVYSPEVVFYLRRRHRRRDMTGWSPDATHYVVHHRFAVRLPVIGWRRAYAWRRVGALRLHSIEARLIYAAFRPPRKGN